MIKQCGIITGVKFKTASRWVSYSTFTASLSFRFQSIEAVSRFLPRTPVFWMATQTFDAFVDTFVAWKQMVPLTIYEVLMVWGRQEACAEALGPLKLQNFEGLRRFFQFQRAKKGTVLWQVGDELLGLHLYVSVLQGFGSASLLFLWVGSCRLRGFV